MRLITVIITAAVLCIANMTNAQDRKITATVVNATSDSGKVGFALYNQQKAFMKTPIQSKASTIKDGKSTVVFENLPEGNYSVVCFHDKNENGTIDFSDRGMPLEDFGASNNVMAFAPPTYEGSKFKLTDKDVELSIRF